MDEARVVRSLTADDHLSPTQIAKLLGCRVIATAGSEEKLRLAKELGADCVGKLRGMFAFAVYDERRRRLVLPLRDEEVREEEERPRAEDNATLSRLVAVLEVRALKRSWVQRLSSLLVNVVRTPSVHEVRNLVNARQLEPLPDDRKLLCRDEIAGIFREVGRRPRTVVLVLSVDAFDHGDGEFRKVLRKDGLVWDHPQ
jgi:hypothetical protein